MGRGPGNQTVRPQETDSSLQTKADRPPRSQGLADLAAGLLPGTLVADRYRIASVLGRGGVGQVYRADDLKLEQPVALKLLPEEVRSNPYRRDRFLDEVRLARQITHPNICRIYDVVEDGTRSFISMEYIDGEDLATLLKRIGHLPPDKAVAIGLDLCAGLGAIHERGILHRDLKPSNLMVDGEGRARITDFGMAGWTGSRPHGGTPSYMAPEQLLSLEISPQSDLYALGLVLYELFTGARAFDRPRLAALAERPEPPSKRVRDLDPAVEAVILRCLEKDPRDRPGSAAAVAKALDRSSERSWRPAEALEIPHRPHWVLAERIGRGGCGEVWLAVHSKTRERHVFKFCYELEELRTLQREVTLYRFLREKLGERDDVVHIFDWSFEEPPYFLESEHAAGGNLLDWATARGGLGAVPLAERLGVVAKVARSLAAAHSVGVLHKDVKPTNVLVAHGAGGAVRICLSDFGVGSVSGRGRLLEAGITALGMTERADGSSRPGGTRLYMAPEVVEGRPATVQADLYALGVMLYQMVVGDFSRVLTPSWRRDVEDDLLADDVAAATDGSPERRLGGPRQLADRLERLEERRVERRTRERQQRFARAGTVVMSALILLSAVLGYHSRRIAREQARTQNLVRVTLAGEWLAKDPTSAALILLEVDRPESTAFAASRMREALYEELALDELRTRRPLLSASVSAGGERVAVLSEDGTAWLWKLDGSGEPRRIDGRGHPIAVLAFHPDGRRLITGSEDGTAFLWDESAGEPVELSSCGGPVRAVAFDPAGERAVTICKGGPIRLSPIAGSRAAGEPVVFTSSQGSAFSASFSPDGRRLLTVSEESVEIWDAAGGGQPLFRFPRRLRPPISAASFDPRGGHVAVVFGDLNPTVEVWSLDGSGETRLLGRHEGPVSSVVFSPDGGSVLTASEDTTARLWRLAGDAEPVILSGHRGRVASAAFSPDGERLVTSSTDGTARVWSLSGGLTPGAVRATRVLKNDEALISAAFDSTGERLVTVSREGTLRLWSLTRPEIFISLRHEGPVSDASFSPNGRLVLTSSEDGTVRLWNADGSGEPKVLGGLHDVMDVTEASFSSNGERILAVYEDLTVRIWPADGEGGALFFERHLAGSMVTQVAFSPEGERLVAATRDGEILMWSVDDPDRSAVIGHHRSWIEDLAVAPDGGSVASAGRDGTVRIWNVDGSGEDRVLDHASRVYAVSFDPTGRRLAAATADGKVWVWQLDRGEVSSVFRHDRLFRAPQFSPNGDLIVTVSRDGTARVGPADGGGRSFFLKGHTNSVVHAAFSPDGRRIVTASRDGTARVWNADGTGEAIVLRHDDAVQAAAFSPDGERVVTASKDGTARVWRLAGTDELRAAIRSATNVCLDPSLRQEVLGEAPETARRHFQSCRRDGAETGRMVKKIQ